MNGVGTLDWIPILDRPDLLAAPVAAALADALLDQGAPSVLVAEIDPGLADTAAFCAAYEVGLEISANCVVLAAKRSGATQLAACLVLATTRADVNGVARRRLDARKASFAAMDVAVAETGGSCGGNDADRTADRRSHAALWERPATQIGGCDQASTGRAYRTSVGHN